MAQTTTRTRTAAKKTTAKKTTAARQPSQTAPGSKATGARKAATPAQQRTQSQQQPTIDTAADNFISALVAQTEAMDQTRNQLHDDERKFDDTISRLAEVLAGIQNRARQELQPGSNPSMETITGLQEKLDEFKELHEQFRTDITGLRKDVDGVTGRTNDIEQLIGISRKPDGTLDLSVDGLFARTTQLHADFNGDSKSDDPLKRAGFKGRLWRLENHTLDADGNPRFVTNEVLQQELFEEDGSAVYVTHQDLQNGTANLATKAELEELRSNCSTTGTNEFFSILKKVGLAGIIGFVITFLLVAAFTGGAFIGALIVASGVTALVLLVTLFVVVRKRGDNQQGNPNPNPNPGNNS